MAALSPSSFQRNSRLLGLIGFFLGMAGLPTSPVALTISSVLIFLGALGAMPLKEQWGKFWANKPAVFISVLFLFQLVSVFYTTNIPGWVNEVRVKAPLPIILYGMSVLAPFTRKELKLAFSLLILATFVTGTITLVNYMLHRAEIDELIAQSKPMEIAFAVPHIYFSIVMAFSVIVGFWVFRVREKVLFNWENWVVGLAAFANFAYLHVLTTRTGLVACYLAILGLGIIIFLQRKQYLRAFVMVAGLSALPVIGYFALPSLQARLVNTYWDVWNYWRGGDPNYLSIATRFESWRVASDLIQRNPVVGVGTADLHDEMTLQYVLSQSLLCPENQVEPHNLFITYFAGFGIPAGLFFVFAWMYPVFLRRKRRLFLFQGFWLISTFAMMGEATLERQVGIMFMALCLIPCLQELETESEPS